MPAMGALELGQMIKDARLRRGWTQKDLANRVGIDGAYVSMIEAGKRNWPQDYVPAFAKVLNLSQVEMAIAADLIEREGPPPVAPYDPERELLIDLLGRVRLDVGERVQTIETILTGWIERDARDRVEETFIHDEPAAGHRKHGSAIHEPDHPVGHAQR